MNKKQLQEKLSKLANVAINEEVVNFVMKAIKDGLPDFKAELKADKEQELEKIEAKRNKLLEDINELK